MTKMTASELRSVNGGKTEYCPYCGRGFKDTKILWWTIKGSGMTKLAKHLRAQGTRCIYSR